MSTPRVSADGKHLTVSGERLVVRGVTYGSFLARSDGARYPEPARVQSDMAAMADLGLNTVRVYDRPPTDVLVAAAEHGLRLLIGLDYEDWRYHPSPGGETNRRILSRGMQAVDRLMDDLDRADVDRGVVLAVSVGNEVPGDLVRVHGPAAVEDTLSALVARIHHHDVDMPVTYTNFPTTEYLRVEGQDLATFNVFLEDGDSFERYLRHLQVISGRLPLVVTELGLASDVHGLDQQARLLDRHLESVSRSGCAGATVFSWTDEWAVNGSPVSGWGFGITDSDRTRKPAAAAVEHWARTGLKDLAESWPRVSVIVCAHNESRHIENCLRSLERSDYPDLEVVVCNDGSTDDTLARARRFPFILLDLPRGGLSRARNAGIEAATGDIIAFLDADAMCHPQWPWFLGLSFLDPSLSAVGGPNLPVPAAGLVERAVALSPGAPTEVLTGDDRAEHIAGCNMAFRASAIRAIDGFDPTYTAAGDDVDVCWKLLDRGHVIGFNPAAQVVHHRRGAVGGYLRQQRGYGRAEKLLSASHPARFNRLGQARWTGVIYGGVGLLPSLLRPRIYHGHQGSAPFQPVSVDRSSVAQSWAIALVPAVAAVAVAGLIGAAFSPWSLVLSALAFGLIVAFGLASAWSVSVARTEPSPLRLRALVGLLHIAQPLARTWGRLKTRTPRSTSAHRGPSSFESSSANVTNPWMGPATADGAAVNGDVRTWTGDRYTELSALEHDLRSARFRVDHLDPASAWDLAVITGPHTRLHVVLGVAWSWTAHVRTAVRPRWSLALMLLAIAAGWLLSPAAGLAATGLFVLSATVDVAGLVKARRLIQRWRAAGS